MDWRNLSGWLVAGSILTGVTIGSVTATGKEAPAAEESDSPVQSAVGAANDPFLFVLLSSGLVYDVKPDRVIEICKHGRVVVHSDYGGLNEGGAVLVPPPEPVPNAIMKRFGPNINEEDFITLMETGGEYGYTGGVLVTKDYHLFFWELTEANVLKVTSGSGKWWYLKEDVTPTESETGLAYRTKMPGGKPLDEGLAPPVASDLITVLNYPALRQARMRYIVPKTLVVSYLTSGRKFPRGVGLEGFGSDFYSEGPWYQMFDPETLPSIKPTDNSDHGEINGTEMVEAEGALVTRKYKIYFWRLFGNVLFLSDGANDCMLRKE